MATPRKKNDTYPLHSHTLDKEREQGRLNEALADFNKAIEQFIIRPSTFALANRGATYYDLGRFSEALTDLNKVLKRDPNNLLALEIHKKVHKDLQQ